MLQKTVYYVTSLFVALRSSGAVPTRSSGGPEVLETVGLSGKANRLPDELSGGEQQRVAPGRSLSTGRWYCRVEPTGNPTRTSRDIMDLLSGSTAPGTTVVDGHADH